MGALVATLVAAMLLLLPAAPAAAGPERVHEVVAVTQRLFYYDIPPTAYLKARRAAADAAGEMSAGAVVSDFGARELEAAVAAIVARHPEQAEAIVTASIRGFVEGLNDPYTTWLSAQDKAMLEAQQSGKAFTGIGIEVAPDPRGLRVVASLEGSPARGAGLRPGDRIAAVNGTSLVGMGLYRASDLLLGPLGSAVSLSVERDGAQRSIRLERASLVIPPVRAGIVERGGLPVGYVRIAIFGPQTGEQTKAALQRLAAQNPRGWIIDLRDNPGGTLSAALDIAGLFAPGQVLLRVSKRGGAEEARQAPGVAARVTKPVVVLINGGTASSSEVLAGALRDLGVATLLGGQSFGKGVIQSMVPLHGGGALRLTTARYRTPAGHDIHGQGLAPDVEAKSEGDALVGRALALIKDRLR